MVPHRGTGTLNVEIGVAVLHTDQTVFGDLGLPKKGIIRPVVRHP